MKHDCLKLVMGFSTANQIALFQRFIAMLLQTLFLTLTLRLLLPSSVFDFCPKKIPLFFISVFLTEKICSL